jgi:hypothetical protein
MAQLLQFVCGGWCMDVTLVLFAMAVGFVSAGVLGSFWKFAFDEEPRFGLLFHPEPTLLTPLRTLAVVFSGPSVVGERALWWMIAQPLIGVPLLAIAAGWSFLQGVFILTQVFGFK